MILYSYLRVLVQGQGQSQDVNQVRLNILDRVGPNSEYGLNTELFFFENEWIPNIRFSKMVEYQIVLFGLNYSNTK